MTELLMTDKRLLSLHRICRFAGWTNRHYGVLEHEVVGAIVLGKTGAPKVAQRAFLIHDHEESEFGDQITPIKRMFKAEYFSKVHDFNRRLCDESGMALYDLERTDVSLMDQFMFDAELTTVYTKGVIPQPVLNEKGRIAAEIIKSGEFASFETAKNEFWRIWDHGF